MTNVTIRDVLNLAMREEMECNQQVILMGEEVAEYNGAYKISKGLLDSFGPMRVIDTPITEHGFAGIGVGMAMSGMRPIVEFMTWNFGMQAIDQIINSAAKTRYMSGGEVECPIVFRGPNGAAARVGAQHSQEYASWYAHIPGLTVIAPYYPADCKGLLKSAIRSNDTVVFLENEVAYGHEYDVQEGILQDKDYLVPIGKANVLKQGDDVTIVAYSLEVLYAMQAADILNSVHGINAEVIDLRTIRPLDIDTIIESVKKTNHIVSVEQGWAFSGIAGEINVQIIENAFDYLDSEPIRVSAKDAPLPYAENLERIALPQIDDIIDAVLVALHKK